MDDVIKKLPGDLRKVAELIGIESALTLVEHFGGGYLVIPKCDGLLKEIRDNKIRELYDSGKYTQRELAWRFKLTDRTIKTILSESDKEVPAPLLEIMQSKL